MDQERKYALTMLVATVIAAASVSLIFGGVVHMGPVWLQIAVAVAIVLFGWYVVWCILGIRPFRRTKRW